MPRRAAWVRSTPGIGTAAAAAVVGIPAASRAGGGLPPHPPAAAAKATAGPPSSSIGRQDVARRGVELGDVELMDRVMALAPSGGWTAGTPDHVGTGR